MTSASSPQVPFTSRSLILAVSFTILYFSVFHFSLFSAEIFVLLLLLYLFFTHTILSPHPADHAEMRRSMFKDYIEPEYQHHDVDATHEYMINTNGNLIFTRLWKSKHLSQHPPKAIILFLHGYSASSSSFTHIYANRFVDQGYIFAGLDHYGHGRSDGMLCYIPDFNRFIDDAHQYAQKLKLMYPNLKLFTFSESMGGAVALKLAVKYPPFYAGHILMAPMCKVSDSMRPPEPVVKVLLFLAKFFPTWPIVPTPNISDRAFKRRDVLEKLWTMVGACRYERKPRLGTAVTMLKTTQEVEQNFDKVTAPILVLHGDADIVTDPLCSQALYERARSADKTLKLYRDAWHVLLVGEPPEVAERIYEDIFAWVARRV